MGRFELPVTIDTDFSSLANEAHFYEEDNSEIGPTDPTLELSQPAQPKEIKVSPELTETFLDFTYTRKVAESQKKLADYEAKKALALNSLETVKANKMGMLPETRTHFLHNLPILIDYLDAQILLVGYPAQAHIKLEGADPAQVKNTKEQVVNYNFPATELSLPTGDLLRTNETYKAHLRDITERLQKVQDQKIKDKNTLAYFRLLEAKNELPHKIEAITAEIKLRLKGNQDKVKAGIFVKEVLANMPITVNHSLEVKFQTQKISLITAESRVAYLKKEPESAESLAEIEELTTVTIPQITQNIENLQIQINQATALGEKSNNIQTDEEFTQVSTDQTGAFPAIQPIGRSPKESRFKRGIKKISGIFIRRDDKKAA